MACLSDNEVAALVCRALPASALAAAEQHLDGCPACFEAVSAAARADDDSGRATTTVVERPATPGPPRAASPAPPAGVLGRYVLLEPIGEGGMGRVFAAHDPQLSRRVAIKILRDDLSSAADDVTHREVLLREARAMAQLAHPNVVAVHDVGVAGSHVFLAMELVEGATLERWSRAAERTTDEVLDVFLQAGRGLLAAHQAGIVHRDFKPRNVLVGRDGRVRVTDFGLARPVTDSTRSALEEPGRAHHTVAAGTPAYMAPEQFEGAPASASSDQFSFCLSLHECLHGQLPFRKGRRVRPELLRPERLVASALTAAIERGLSVDPAARFPELSALLDALERARTAPTVPAEAAHRPWGIALAGAAAVAMLAAVLAWAEPWGAGPETSAALAPPPEAPGPSPSPAPALAPAAAAPGAKVAAPEVVTVSAAAPAPAPASPSARPVHSRPHSAKKAPGAAAPSVERPPEGFAPVNPFERTP